MTKGMTDTRIRYHIRAPRTDVYRAMLDPAAVARWRVPEGMTSEVHHFEAWEGGRFRVSLTHETATGMGKTTSQTDTCHGRFVRLVPDELIVERVEFETSDPSMQGEMTITTSLVEADDGTDLIAEHAGLPPGVSPADNEIGWQMSLRRLADLVESRTRSAAGAHDPQ